ncbi:Metallo-beta-lactamase family protein [Entamoeba marina]
MSHLLIAGTAAGKPTTIRSTTSTVLYTHRCSDLFLIDCGDGITSVLTKMKVTTPKIRAILITHSHCDHVAGVANFIYSITYKNPTKLTIAAPVGIKKVIDAIFDYSGDIIPETVDFIELSDTEITEFEIAKTQITSIPVPHLPNIKGHAFLCETVERGQPRSVLFSGDTNNIENAIALLKTKKINLDILVHECTYDNMYSDAASKWGHSTPQIVQNSIKEINPKKCIINHYSSRNPNSYVREIAQSIQKETNVQTIAGEDGKVIVF